MLVVIDNRNIYIVVILYGFMELESVKQIALDWIVKPVVLFIIAYVGVTGTVLELIYLRDFLRGLSVYMFLPVIIVLILPLVICIGFGLFLLFKMYDMC